MHSYAKIPVFLLALSLQANALSDEGSARRHLDCLESNFDSGFYLLVNESAQKFLSLSESQVDSIKIVLKKDLSSGMPLNQELIKWLKGDEFNNLDDTKRQLKKSEMYRHIRHAVYLVLSISEA